MKLDFFRGSFQNIKRKDHLNIKTSYICLSKKTRALTVIFFSFFASIAESLINRPFVEQYLEKKAVSWEDYVAA